MHVLVPLVLRLLVISIQVACISLFILLLLPTARSAIISTTALSFVLLLGLSLPL